MAKRGRKRIAGEKYLGGVVRTKAGGFEWRGTIRNYGRKSLFAATVGEVKSRVKALVARLGGTLALDEMPTFGDYLEDRIRHDAPELRITTVESYESRLRIVRGDEIADLALDALSPVDFDGFFERLRFRKPGMRPTWRQTYSFMWGSLNRAVLQRIIPHHPMDGVRRPAKVEKTLALRSRRNAY